MLSKRFAILLLPAFCLLLSCNNAPTLKTKDANSISVTDFRGKEVNLDHPAKRIVCLIESALSGIYMLNTEDKVVGISSNVYSEDVFRYYASMDKRIENKSIPAPGNWDFANIESVIALNPDLVIIWANQTESIESIEGKGIPVYGVMLKSLNDVYKEISDLGTLTAKTTRADSIISFTKNEISCCQYVISEKPAIKSIYFSWVQGLLETSGQNSMVNELIELSGCKNVCTSPDEHITINKEKLIEWDPDIIVMWCNSRINSDNIYEMKELARVKAVRNRKVFQIPSSFLCDLWTLKFQYAVKLLSVWANPDKLSDLKLKEEKAKILKGLYGGKAIKLANE